MCLSSNIAIVIASYSIRLGIYVRHLLFKHSCMSQILSKRIKLTPTNYIYELYFSSNPWKHQTTVLIYFSSYVSFNNSNTRSFNNKLHHKLTTNSTCQPVFFRLPKLWNALQIIDLPFFSTKLKLMDFII